MKSTLRFVWLLLGLELRRRFNMIDAALRRRSKQKAPAGPRKGTARKSSSLGLAILGFGYIVFAFSLMSAQQLEAAFARQLYEAGSLILFMRVICCACVELSGQELIRADWDLEWLVTMPIPRATLLAVRLLLRAIVSQTGLMMVVSFTIGLAYTTGWRFSTPVMGIFLGFPMVLIMASIVAVAEAWARLQLRPDRMRNLQALLSVFGLVVLYLSIVPNLVRGETFTSVVRAWSDLGAWTALLPWSLAVSSARGGSGVEAFVLYVEALAVATLAVVVLHRMLANGVVAGGAWESGRESRAARPRRRLAAPPRRSWLTPTQQKDLLLLRRDRNFMVQALVIPVVIAGAQFVLNPQALEGILHKPTHTAAVIFGFASLVLMSSAFNVLIREGKALWLLYTLPCSLESMLRQKATFWGAMTVVYATVAMGVALAVGVPARWDTLGAFVMVLVGVPIYAAIATSLGVDGTDLAEEVPQKQVRPSFVYLFMLLASIYSYTIYAEDWWTRCILTMLTALLAMAMWQKTRDKLPYILDPTEDPPARVTLADGMIAVQVFFVLQALIFLLFDRVGVERDAAITMAFGLAGLLIYALVQIIYYRSGTADVPRILGPGASRAVLPGLCLGVIAAGFGVGYQQLMAGYAPHDVGRMPALGWMLLLAVIAAPLSEEFIFRGLIFGGLRRWLSAPVAILISSLLFAMLHPPFAVIPVFVMALFAARVYEYQRSLLGPMLVHGVYNLTVVVAAYSQM